MFLAVPILHLLVTAICSSTVTGALTSSFATGSVITHHYISVPFRGFKLGKRNMPEQTELPAQIYGCSPLQVDMIEAAFHDNALAAMIALSVFQNPEAKHIALTYHFTTDRHLVQQMFHNLALASDVEGSHGPFILTCGDVPEGLPDPSSDNPGDVTPSMDGCVSDKAGYVLHYAAGAGEEGIATNVMALCPPFFEAKRGGNLAQAIVDLDKKSREAFCAETDLNHGLTVPSLIAFLRRNYYRGLVILHELTHTLNVGFPVKTKEPCGDYFRIGTADFAYSEDTCYNLPPEKAIRNAQSYVHYTWRALYWLLCNGKTPISDDQVQLRRRSGTTAGQAGGNTGTRSRSGSTSSNSGRGAQKRPLLTGHSHDCKEFKPIIKLARPKSPTTKKKKPKSKPQSVKRVLKKCRAGEFQLPFRWLGKIPLPKVWKLGKCIAVRTLNDSQASAKRPLVPASGKKKATGGVGQAKQAKIAAPKDPAVGSPAKAKGSGRNTVTKNTQGKRLIPRSRVM